MTIYTSSKKESRVGSGSANEANGLMTTYTPSKTDSRDGELVLMRLMGYLVLSA